MKDITLINFTKLSLSNKKMVRLWRNDNNVKKWMYTNTDISLQNHLSYIELLKKTKEKLYFLVKQKNNFLGVIYFLDINKQSTKFGLYSNPELSGVGKILLEAICNYAFKILKIKILKAEVFIDNIKAIKLYKKFNFIETNRKVIVNNEVLCMELKIEDESKSY